MKIRLQVSYVLQAYSKLRQPLGLAGGVLCTPLTGPSWGEPAQTNNHRSPTTRGVRGGVGQRLVELFPKFD